MKVRATILILAGGLAVAPLALAQDHAVPRGGGGGGGGGGSAGGGHPGVSQSGGGSSSGGSTYSGSSAGGSSYSPSTAERRHPRAGTGRGSGGYYPGGGGYYPCYGCGAGWYYPGYSGGYWWPYASYGWYGGYWGYPWGWGGGGYTVYRSEGPRTGSVRVLVDPAEARVYVDGYYAGSVDDFDGLFQRLNVPVGRHEIAIKLEGYKTYRMKIYVPGEGTVKIQHDLEKGTGETFEDLAGDAPAPEVRRDRDEDRRADRDRPDTDEPTATNGTGRLRIDVRPADASVYVDGAFRGTAREAASLRLPAGRHRVEVVRPGYRTDEREVEVTAGETTQLEVDLERGAI
jgi:hypothetical protein